MKEEAAMVVVMAVAMDVAMAHRWILHHHHPYSR
jgi:hypothetical protein